MKVELRQAGGLDVTAQVEKATHSLAAAEGELAALRRELHTLEGQLMAADLIGMHDRLAEARANHEMARAQVEPLRRRAEALELLNNTLTTCRAEARESVVVPLRRAVEPLVRTVFGDAQVAFDRAFGLQAIQRDNAVDSFDALSGGAQEQLALLVRLGMARVLAGDSGLTVMLDDAIVASDEDRFARMVEAVKDVAEQLQVVLFTCHWERYAPAVPEAHAIDLAKLAAG